MILQHHLIDLHQKRIYPAEIEIKDEKIQSIRELGNLPEEVPFILPGFVDAHVHIESSMLPPAEFARLAVVHGTVATVSDPHEIANVLGIEGVEFMLNEAKKVPLKFCFGAPSCVPATTFETAGATLDAEAVRSLLERTDIGYLAEMMNFPAVLGKEEEVMKKIAYAHQLGKPIDGHAPALMGDAAKQYFAAGISTDHECFSYEEGKQKAEIGVKILIREGSAARNFEALWPLIQEFPAQIMFCSDDKHPDDLIQGHINQLVQRALTNGCDLFDVLRAACVHPVEHYQLPVGLLREGDPADFVIVRDLDTFSIQETWLNGSCVARDGQSRIIFQPSPTPNYFIKSPMKPEEFRLAAPSSGNQVRVIQALDGQIITGRDQTTVSIQDGYYQTDVENDVLLMAVVNRYAKAAPPAMGFVRGFGLKKGAIASSVAHDSHNIVAIGIHEEALCQAVNAIIETKGGISAVNPSATKILPLPIAGLMSPENGYELAQQYSRIDSWVKETLGCTLQAPFMLLSFLALPVIPSLKMTDLGVFDVDAFEFVSVDFSES
ncbi:MAG: adenine deaminase [Bacteroidota bacterium]